MNRLLFIVLFSMINNLFAEENCTISTEVENLSCNGTVRAKSISDIEIYKQNLGIKNNIAKNLLIDFDPNIDQELSISTPCQVTVSKDRKIEGKFSFCINAKRGIVFLENQNIKVNNMSLYSEDEIIIRHDSRIIAHDLILKSNGVTTYSKVRLGYNTSLNANSLLMDSFDYSSIGQNSILNIENNFELYSRGELDSVIGQYTSVNAKEISINARDELKIGSGSILNATTIILNGENCYLNLLKNQYNSNEKIGSCFFQSSPQALFSIDNYRGQSPLIVSFDSNKIENAIRKIFYWGDGAKLISNDAVVEHTYANVGKYTARLSYATEKNELGKYIYKSAGAVNVEVLPLVNQIPSANISCQVSGLLVSCDGLLSIDPDGFPMSYRFAFYENDNDILYFQNSIGLANYNFKSDGIKKVVLIVTDHLGIQSTSELNVSVVKDPQIPPTLKIDCQSKGVHNVSCSTEGSIDTDGVIVKYSYYLDSGLVGETSSGQFQFQSQSGGEHLVKVIAVDDAGLEVSKEISLNIIENTAPSVTLSCFPLDGTFVKCIANGIENDVGDEIVNYVFKFNDIDEISSQENVLTYEYDTFGTYTPSVTIFDHFGKSANASASITISNSLKPYFKYFLDGRYISLKLADLKEYDQIEEAYYLVDENIRLELLNYYPNSTITFNFDNFGEHKVELVVVDKTMAIKKYMHIIYIPDDNEDILPFAEFDYYESEPSLVYFDFVKSFSAEVDSPIEHYEIDFGDGNKEEFDLELLKTFTSHKYENAGEYDVQLTIWVGSRKKSINKKITVAGKTQYSGGPIVNFQYYIFNFAGNVSFYDEQSFSTNGEILSYEWDFGDGVKGYGRDTVHFYEPGTYEVKLTVTDSLGMKNSQRQLITIKTTGSDLVLDFYCDNTAELETTCSYLAVDRYNQINFHELDWGDGTKNIDVIPIIPELGMFEVVHKYSSAGTYQVQLEINTVRGERVSRKEEIIHEKKNHYADLYCTSVNLVVSCNVVTDAGIEFDNLKYIFDMGNGDLIENATGQLVYFYKDAGLQKINVSIENKNTKIIEAQTQVLTVIAQNRPPVAAMNCNSPAPLKLFCNPMSSNDIDGTIIRYEYEIDGKILSSAAPDFINYYYQDSGEKRIGLTVFDNDGAFSKMEMQIEITSNNNPQLTLSCNSSFPYRVSCTANAFDSDNEDLITKYEWYIDNELKESNMFESFFKADNITAGLHTVKNVVYDKFGGRSESSISVDVKVNIAPVANFSCNLITNSEIQCYDNSSDFDDGIKMTEWNIEGVRFTGNSIRYQFENGGEKEITLKVTDGFGATSELIKKITTNNPQISLNCQLDKYTVTCLGQVLSTIDDNGSYRLKTNYSNEDFVDGLDSSHEYLTSGDKEIVLTLLQDEEVVSKVKTIVNIPVQYMSPDANFIFLYDESYKAVGFDAEMSLKQDRSIKKYIWDFGDGNIVESSDKRITHSFSESKTYLVKLTVVDVLENTSSKVREVYVPTFSVVAPDHSIAKETLLGIDSNTNLIRDDVERAIEILSKGNLTVKRNLLYIAHNFETGYRKSDIEAELNLLMRKTIDSLACLNKELNDERKVETLYSYLVLFYKNTPERSLIYYRLAESVNGESFQTRLSDEDLESFCLGVKNGN